MTNPLSPTLPWVVFVGGFLGAGKTTLLFAAARELEQRGMRSAIVLNDQSGALVDTEYARLHGLHSSEVAGGCFCCRLSELLSVIDDLRQFSPDVIFAEPVGSCTDISATVLHPLMELSHIYRIAPFTVCVDPARAHQLSQSSGTGGAQFLFKHQINEADLICFTKSDLGQMSPDIPSLFRGSQIRHVSAFTGQGVSAWLDEIMSGSLSAASTILDIDYEQYARAEASLAWLNLEAEIEPPNPMSAIAVLGPLFERIDTGLSERHIEIVHLKALLASPLGFIKAAICSNQQEPILHGSLDSSPAKSHSLLLNLRALGDAEDVRQTVNHCLRQTEGIVRNVLMNCFHPAAPRPERRIAGPA